MPTLKKSLKGDTGLFLFCCFCFCFCFCCRVFLSILEYYPVLHTSLFDAIDADADAHAVVLITKYSVSLSWVTTTEPFQASITSTSIHSFIHSFIHQQPRIDHEVFTMGQPSTQASNALIYLTYGAFLCVLSFPTIGQSHLRQIAGYCGVRLLTAPHVGCLDVISPGVCGIRRRANTCLVTGLSLVRYTHTAAASAVAQQRSCQQHLIPSPPLRSEPKLILDRSRPSGTELRRFW